MKSSGSNIINPQSMKREGHVHIKEHVEDEGSVDEEFEYEPPPTKSN